ncbi:MAG: glycine/sarcosine/betaine reductase component B subunit [Vulcanimicrobiaceae bacterium]
MIESHVESEGHLASAPSQRQGKARALTLKSFHVRSLEWASTGSFSNGSMTLNHSEIITLASDPANFADVTVDLAHPSDGTRIVNVLDAVQPMVKTEGVSCAYPGVEGPALIAGSGTTNRIEGLAIVSCGVFPHPPSGVLSTKRGFIDMGGEAAPYCDASDTHNIIITAAPRPGISNGDFDSAMRAAVHRVSRHIAEYTRHAQPDDVRIRQLSAAHGLPRIAYILQLQDQGPLIRPLLYGHHFGEDFIATYIHPNEILDGAIVSANYRATLKMSSRMFANAPVLLELYDRHGVDLDFAGVVLKRGHHANHFLKERAAEYAANLVDLLDAESAVLSAEATGNTTIDFMQTIRSLERRGINSTGIFHELGGPMGSGTPLVDSVEEAISLISSGNAEQPISIGVPKRVVGGDTFTYYTQESADPYGALQVSALECFCGMARMAAAGFTAVDY